MKVTKDQSYKIQLLRGLAIIAVVCIHNTPLGLAQVWCRPFLNFPVGLFLFLSAMLSSAERWNPWKRIYKVAVPYVIWTLVYVLLHNVKSPSQIPVEFVKSLLIANSAAVMYYIFIYCEFTLLIPLIDKLARSKYKYLGFCIAPIEILLMRTIPLVTGITVNKYLGILSGISCLGWFTYYYLGYMVGNNLIEVKTSTKKLVIFWAVSIGLQVLEGYWYFSMGEANCGTQLKLTSILSGSLFALMAYRFITNEKHIEVKTLYLLGNVSFGIYFAHLAVMAVFGKVSYYNTIAVYPINALITLVVTSVCVLLGRKILGKNAKYLAL